MPALKPVSGHRSVRWLKRYLEGESGERVLGRDFWNLSEKNGRAGRDWAAQMDLTREEFGNDVPYKGKRVQTYKHYMLSPDPRDEVSLETLRDVTMQWVERNFPQFEVAVTYHDDNQNHIPHAHVVINNTNLERGTRITTYLDDRRVREIGRDLNRIALEMGLRSFTSDHRSLTPDEIASSASASSSADADVLERARRASRDGRVSGRPGVRRGPKVQRVVTIPEREARRRTGRSWKSELRVYVDIARLATTSEAGFTSMLRSMGVAVRADARGEWVLTHPGAGDGPREVRASRLGAAYSRRSIRRGFALDYAGWRKRSAAPGRAAPPLSDAQRDSVVESITVIGRQGSSPLPSLEEIARTLDFNRAHAVTRLSDYTMLEGPEADAARRCAEAIGLFDTEARARDTRAARDDARVVLDWMAARDARGEGGREAYPISQRASRGPAPTRGADARGRGESVRRER